MLHLTNPCAKWKVLSLTKPEGKIYKTKSLGYYITVLLDRLVIAIILPIAISFYTSFKWWCFTGIWGTSSLFTSPGLFTDLWPISTILKFVWSRFVLQFLSFSAPVPNFWGSSQVHHLQDVSPLLSCFIVFFVPWQGLSICLTFRFLLFKSWESFYTSVSWVSLSDSKSR